MNQQRCVKFFAACAVLGLAITNLAAQSAPGEVNVPTGEVSLGSVELPRQVMANGETLVSGAYDVFVTAAQADPEAPGQLAVLERWVEFRQAGAVQGREVVSIVPGSEISDVAKSAPPASGTARIETLRENEYLRIWVNQSDTHYFIHLVVS